MTEKEIVRYIEGRAGTRWNGAAYEPIGGGLYGCETACIDTDYPSFPKTWYERQRIELEHLMTWIRLNNAKT
jgi:hypothetical protein